MSVRKMYLIYFSPVVDVFWIPSKHVSHEFSNGQTDFVMHVKLSDMLVIGWMLLVVNCGKTVQSSSHLEDFAHPILQESFASAVVVEAEVCNIIQVGVNFAGVVEHEVEVEEKTLKLHKLIKLESGDELLKPVQLDH